LLADEVADFLGIRRVLVPPNPGNLSAFGLQATDVKRDHVRTLVRHVDGSGTDAVADELETVWQELERQGADELRSEGVRSDRVSIVRGADLRYVGEGYEVSVLLPAGVTGAAAVRAAEDAFHAEHDRIYGFSYRGEQDVEIVSLRTQAVGELHRPVFETLPGGTADPRPRGSRKVYWRGSGWLDCPIYDRSELGAGSAFAGPAIVEEYGSTYVVPAGWRASVDGFGNILSEREA